MDSFPRVGRRPIRTGRATALAVVALFAGILAAKASAAAAAAEGHAHTIRVASLGDGAGAESLRARVIERLKTSGGFKVIEGSSALNAAGKDAYPISTFTWLLIPAEGLSAEKRTAVAALLIWALTAGQKECASLGYAPLPHAIADRELQAVNAMKR